MRTLMLLLLIAAAAWGGYRHFNQPDVAMDVPIARISADRSRSPERVLPKPTDTYSCDGRQHCSQMRSCDEATFFIRNCPDTKMDGDNDGVPCESQWCG